MTGSTCARTIVSWSHGSLIEKGKSNENCDRRGRKAGLLPGKNPVGTSIFDGIGMGLGFTVGLTVIGIFRELLGAGTIFGFDVLNRFNYEPIAILVLAPGAFFVLAALTALQNKFKAPSATNGPEGIKMSCGGNCGNCADGACAANHKILADEKLALAKAAAEEKAKKAAEAKETE